jgi:methionyl-tRNA formyltransferase
MRIVLIGQAAFGAKFLESLLERNEELAAVYAIPDQPGRPPDPLKEAAMARGIRVIQPRTYKDDAVFSEYRTFSPELTVMAFVTAILPERYFSVPRFGTINYHPSLLPRHRGGSAINWAVIMGDKRTGLTIFWPDGGIDTGPILLQKEIEIGPEDTTGTLYFNRLFPMGVEAILESLERIKAGNAPRIPQDEAAATYEPLCNDRVAGIDWMKSGEEVHNLVRGCDPQPGAFTHFRGRKVRFFGSRLIRDVAAAPAPGTILGIDEQGVHVAVSGGRLVVARMKTETGNKSAAAELAAELGINVGDRFSPQA